MKTKTIKWGDKTWEFYKPQYDRKKQLGLGIFIVATGLIPGPNFIGAVATKILLKVNPLFLFK